MPISNMTFEEASEEFKRIQTKLSAINRRSLTERQAADYFNQISGACFAISNAVETREQANKTTGLIAHTLQLLTLNISEKEKDLRFFMHTGSHGFQDLSGLEAPKNASVDYLKTLFFYNGLHWSGVANLSGADSPFKDSKIPFEGTALEFTRDGKIRVTPKILKEMISATPHLVNAGFEDKVKISVTGEAELTPGQLFALLRSASNALHSIKMNIVLHSLRTAVEDASIKKVVEERSNPENYERICRESLGGRHSETTIQSVIKMLQETGSDTDLRTFGLISPEAKQRVLDDLLKQRLENFEIPHYAILRAVAGLSENQFAVFTKIHENIPKELTGPNAKYIRSFKRAWRKADGRNSLVINLSPESKKGVQEVQLLDKGLGKEWSILSERRPFSGTSAYLQKRAGERKTKCVRGGALTRLRFR